MKEEPTAFVKDAIWIGQTAIRPGIGVFRGHTGDNHMHAHGAHQLTIGIEQTVCVASKFSAVRGRAVFVPANTPHQLMPTRALAVYIDPITDEARAILSMLHNPNDILEPPTQLVSIVLQSFGEAMLGEHCFQRFRAQLRLGVLPPRDAVLDAVLRTLQASLVQEETVDRSTLAAVAGLSERRFSHWFREQTGMPVRSYRKWLRLVRGIEQALAGDKLTDAAHGAGFSEQAHFTRTFVAMFGINPSIALAHLRSQPSGQ